MLAKCLLNVKCLVCSGTHAVAMRLAGPKDMVASRWKCGLKELRRVNIVALLMVPLL